MATSQNGWVASADKRSIAVEAFTVAGVDFPGGVKRGDVATVLGYVAQRLHDEVEPLSPGWCWGWNYRDVRGSTGLSNHASGTAIDVNAPRHPIGLEGTFTVAQRARIRSIVNSTGGVVRWGGDYSGRKDEMHFEINSNATAVANLATAIRKDDDMAGEGPNILATVLTGGPSTRGITKDDQGRMAYPQGVDPTSVIGRLADVQEALTAFIPRVDRMQSVQADDLERLATAVEQLTARVTELEAKP